VAFDVGDTVPLTIEVRDAAGALTVASGVVLTLTLPDATTSTPAVSTPSTGRYQADYVPAVPGRYLARWVSTAPATAYVDQFDVRPTAPAYIVSMADAKRHLNMSATSTVDDEELRAWIEATTEVVEDLAGRKVPRQTVVDTRLFECPVGRFALQAPVISLTSIVDMDGFLTWSPAQFNLDGETGIVTVLATGLPVQGLVQITYVAGYQLVPAKFAGAAKSILRHLWESQRAQIGGGRHTQFGIARSSSEEDTVMVAGYAVPRAAAELIGTALPGIA